MRKTRRITKDELNRIRDIVQNDGYLLDGVDVNEECPLTNNKTKDFVKMEGIDEAVRLIEYIVANPDKMYFSQRDGIYEEDAWILKRNDKYLKLFRLYSKNGAIIVVHPF